MAITASGSDPVLSEITAPSAARLEGIDFARAIAFLGMTVVNFHIYIDNAATDPAWATELASLFSGRAAATFVFIAGVGTALLTARWRRTRSIDDRRMARLSLLKRGLFLFIAGVSFRAQWPYDILHFYGVYLALAALLFTLNTRWLIVLVMVTPLLFVAEYLAFPPLLGWDYWESPSFEDPVHAFRDVFFTGHHPVFPWFAFFLAGLAIGRADLHMSANHWRLLFGGIVLIAMAQAVHFSMIGLNYIKLLPVEDWGPGYALSYIDNLFGTSAYPPSPLYVMFGLGVGMIVLSLSLMLCAADGRRRLVKPVIYAGQMALTLYLAHVFIGVTGIEWFLPEEMDSIWALYAIVIVFFLASIIFATIWRRYHKRGPVEWAMRRLVD
ncbi:DUF418 domain-containing protein [Hyphobacterium sp.]|uniref:DUF418 domain-containing protein n=1 Tax=Hyphobacterium sp. TaxID=2004662 RepID=UPI003B526BA2